MVVDDVLAHHFVKVTDWDAILIVGLKLTGLRVTDSYCSRESVEVQIVAVVFLDKVLELCSFFRFVILFAWNGWMLISAHRELPRRL